MHRNFLFDPDQTLLDFHAIERKALEIVIRANGLTYSEDAYRHFKAYNKALWLELEKGNITRTELWSLLRSLNVMSLFQGYILLPMGLR